MYRLIICSVLFIFAVVVPLSAESVEHKCEHTKSEICDHKGKKVKTECTDSIDSHKKCDGKHSEAEVAPVPQTTCPVMGGTVDKKVYVDHQGARVYFCCEMCKGTFKGDPQKYLDIIKANGEQPEVLN